MIEEIYHMIDDLTDEPFWGNVPNRAYAIKQALLREEEKRGYSSDPAYAAQFQAKGIQKAQIEVVGRAVDDVSGKMYPNSKWAWDRIVRFWSPHYPILKEFVDSTTSLLRQTQKMHAADQPMIAALAKYEKELNLTKEEIGILQGLVADTSRYLEEVRRDSVTLFGREITPGNPVNRSDIKVRELVAKLKSANAKGDEALLARQSELDMDALDEVMDAAWARKHPGEKFPVDLKRPEQLEVRFPEYRRRTGEERTRYLGITETRNPKESSYDVRKKWEVEVTYDVSVTRKRQVQDGDKVDANGQPVMKDETYPSQARVTKTYTDDGPDRLRAYYEEVLIGDVEPDKHLADLSPLPSPNSSKFPAFYASDITDSDVVSVNTGSVTTSASNQTNSVEIVSHNKSQVSAIVQKASAARQVENPYRDVLATAMNVTGAVTNESYKKDLATPGAREQLLKSLEVQMQILVKNRAPLATYASNAAAAIQGQWRQDIPQDFTARNEQLVTQYDLMIKRIDHLASQVRRSVPTLEIEYKGIPNYDKELALVKAEQTKDNKTKVVVGTTAAVGTVVGGTAYYNSEAIKGWINENLGDNQNR